MQQLLRLWSLPRAVLITIAVLIMACAAIRMFGYRTSSASARAESFELAQRRWAARPFTHYRMVVKAPWWCTIDVEIKDERVIAVHQNTCPGAPQTVSQLFDNISGLDSQSSTIYCAPGGCECVEQRIATAEYDQQLGYPRTISLRRLRATNWPELGHYFLAHGWPSCLTPLDTELVNVLAIQPLT